MDELRHPLATSSPSRGAVQSPSPAIASDINSNLRAPSESVASSTAQYEQQGLGGIDGKAFRGRSKSLASSGFTSNLPPRLPVDYHFGPAVDDSTAGYAPSTGTNVPYKARSWEPTLEKAIKAIVSIKASHVRSFDTETSGKKKEQQ